MSDRSSVALNRKLLIGGDVMDYVVADLGRGLRLSPLGVKLRICVGGLGAVHDAQLMRLIELGYAMQHPHEGERRTNSSCHVATEDGRKMYEDVKTLIALCSMPDTREKLEP